MRTRIALAALAALLFGALCGCQAAPEEAVVASKNDGAFEKALEDSGEADNTAAENHDGIYTYQTDFTNTAGDIAYTVDIEIPDADKSMPVIQVRPMEITAEQAKTVAQALFDGADMYEYTEELSKSELEEEILSIRQKLGDYDALLEYYGGDEDTAEYMQSIYESQLAVYEAAYQTADETIEPQLCQWTFYPESHYRDVSESDTMYIIATAEMNGWPYEYSVCNRNESDYRIHSASAYIDPMRITTNEVYGAGLDYPSEANVESVRALAETMLEEMGFSDWIIDSCTVGERYLSSGQTAYPITVEASPAYEGIPVVRQAQIMNLKTDDEYASNYYYETITIEFCGGKLTYFEYQAPLEAVQIVNDSVGIMTAEEVAAQFENQMKLTDIAAYQLDMSASPTVVGVDIAVSDVDFGLTRTRIQNNNTDFYLVPAYTFRGEYTIAYSNGTKEGPEEVTLVTINAVDGSIINTQLGY